MLHHRITLLTLSLLLCAACASDSATSEDEALPEGAACQANSDCTSGYCIGLVCRAPNAASNGTTGTTGTGNGTTATSNGATSNGTTGTSNGTTGGTSNTTSPTDAGQDADPPTDAALDTMAPPDTTEGDTSETDDVAPDQASEPVDCDPLSVVVGWQLCSVTDDACGAVFTDGTGCAALCAAAGLVCGATYEDIDDACLPDETRPELSCSDPSGHRSDYCVCVRDDCVGQCDPGQECGGDGCGGDCGTCRDGLTCDDGQCVEDNTGPEEDCTRYPYRAETLLSERAGFGRQTTGGDPDRIYRVTTRSDGGEGSLRRALESTERYWIVFDIEGTITHRNDAVEVQSHKTIDGRGRDITIEGELKLNGVRNIIISDVKLSNDLEGHCTQDGDVISVRGEGGDDPSSYTARDIWVHHVELFNGGDGLFDLRGASRVTLSWSHLHTHKKAMLMGETADNRPAPGMQVTFHHNFFDRLTLRGPQFLFGQAHYFNNYQYQWYEYGAASLAGAQFYSEGNIYESREGEFCIPPCPDSNPCGDNDFFVSKQALVNEWVSNGAGYIQSVGDWRVNGDEEITVHQPDRVFDPAEIYAYQADIADDALRARIREGAGPRDTYCR